MHHQLADIPNRILDVALGALAQANHHAVFSDPAMDYWHSMSVLNAATAGELLLKAIIAREHPLLIFRDLFQLDDPSNPELVLSQIIEKGRTYNFEHLPKLLWVCTGQRIPDYDSFDSLRRKRNAVEHFCSMADEKSLRRQALEFIYKNMDPLLSKNFGLFAIEFHEDVSVGYDYLIECLIRNELLFSVPDDFTISEFDMDKALSQTSDAYQGEVKRRLSAINRRR